MKKISVRSFLPSKDVVLYLIFGVLTTIVNYLVYIPCLKLFDLSAAVSNMIAWAAAVVFAFATNKPFVFHSSDWSISTLFPELIKFVGTRVFSGFIETLMIFVSVDLLGWNGILWKVITSVFVVILNYIGSKLFVFKA